MIDVTALITATVIPPASSYTARLFFRSSWSAFYVGWLCSAIVGIAGLASEHHWGWMLVASGNALLAVVLWWLHRRRRKRAPRAYGAKSRALVAALVRKARDAAKPRPVLRPVPNPG